MPYNSVRYLKSILIFFFIASQIESVGQVFPVQSTVQLTPPYSLYLSDYAAPGSERLKITAFLLDASRPELNVRFRLRIEGNGIKIETKNEFLPSPVTLLGGVPLQLISSDLAAYFDPRNLNFSGITQREYEQRAALPEGLYQFCFEVLEYNRGVKISNTGCATAWLVLNDPPLVNLPRDNDKVRIQDPQQVVFQWTPRHRGSPNSAFNAEYDFKLVEVWPSTRNPNDAILTSPVIFQTTTSETTLIYGPAETPLEPGRRYAFQIRARAYAGADEVSLFKNNGLTQVSTFVYGDACLPPQNPVASDIGTTRFSVNFDAAPNQTGYSLRYRPIPNSQSPSPNSQSPNAQSPSSNWYTNTSLTPNLTITSLQPNTRYEYQVSSGCGSTTSDYSPLTSITTNDNPGIQYSCGVPLTPFNLDPSQLIETLKVGDVIKAGDFDVVLSKVTGSGGTFSGAGNIEVSYFNRAKVNAEFTNIKVSKELRLVDGYLNVTGAGVEVVPAGFLKLMDDLTEALDKADNKLDSLERNRPTPFDENAAVTSTLITVPGAATVTPGSNGTVVIVDGNGQRTEVPKGTTASVVDGTGKGYIVDSNGKVHPTTAAIAAQAANREYNLKLKFAASAEQKFGFDEKKYDPIATTYTKVEDQYLSWKSVATGQADKVLAILEGTEFDKSKIRYELGGIALMPNAQSPTPNSPTPNSQSLEFRGTADGIEEELIALYDPIPNSQSPSSKTQVLGKLSVVTYNELVKDLVIVPVNGNKYPYGEDALRTQLNKIYGQAVVKWNITFAQNVDVPGIDPFDDGGSGLLSNYSPDMRKVVNAYKANLQPNTYYLFLVKNPKSSTLAGFMPRSKECGFIFLSSNSQSPIPEPQLVHTIAHELGHGAFSLKHTFVDEKYTIQQGGTDNLMDYTLAGTALYKYQWDRMRYPEIVMGLFEDDKAGALNTLALAAFYQQAAPLLTSDSYKDLLKKFKTILEFIKTCKDEKFAPYEQPGIVPYCFWRNQNLTSGFYTSIDNAFNAGVIDGAFSEADAAYHFPEMIKKLAAYPGDLIMAYTIRYFQCTTDELVAKSEELKYAIEELAKAEKEEGIVNGIFNWAKELIVDNEGKKDKLLEYFKLCSEAANLRKDAEEAYKTIISIKELTKLYEKVEGKLSEYFKTVSKTDNTGRYQQGRLLVPAVTTIFTVGTSLATKLERVKKVLVTLEDASPNSWKRVEQELGKLLARGADVPASLVSKLTQQGSTKLKSWLSNKSLSYADNAGAKFSGSAAETKIFNDLDAAIGNKGVVETIEDAQGRLLVRTDATAITETKVISLEVTTTGEYKLVEYKAVYSKGGQSGYPKLSANRLAPDFSDNINNCLHPDVVGKKIEITVTGQMNSNAAKIGDVELANQAAGIAGKSTPTGYTWHHLDDFNPATGKCTMQLVKSTEHQKCRPHTGGVKQWENFFGQTYLRN
jgi:TANFOR domain-containing protein